MKTIKIIDLLIMLANGEEMPRKFTYKGYLWEYDINLKMWFYYFGEGKNHRFDRLFYLNECLNDEIKVIEEDKKIGKIEKLNNVGNSKDIGEFKDKQQINNHILKDKINELIDIVNDLKKEGK